MKRKYFGLLSLLWVNLGAAAQGVSDTTDVFYQHLELNEVTVTGLTGETRLSHSPTPVTLISGRELHAEAATNLIDAIARQPGVAQVTTGSGISKPVIRGLGYNRIVTVSDGVRQEGQQWGDEHGIEIDPQAVSQVEILKGPASLMYGSDAMAGVLLLHPARIAPMGTVKGSVTTGYQTNNGLFDYSIAAGGNHSGFVWNARWSQKLAHQYKNHEDGYVPGTQFREQALYTMLGLNKQWGFSHLTLSYYRLQPGITAAHHHHDHDHEADFEEDHDHDHEAEAEEDHDHEHEHEAEAEEDHDHEHEADTDDYSYGMPLPFQHVSHWKAVWDNSFWLGDNRLKATLGYQQNQRKEYEWSDDEYSLYFRLHTLTYDVRYLVEDLKGWKLAAGVGGMWQRSQNLGEEVLIPAYRLWDVGAFVTAAHDLGPVHIEGGVRLDRRMLHSYYLENCFDDFHRNFNGVSASLGGVWQATEGLNVRLNVARGFRAPNLSELGSNGIHHGTERYELGNHDLKAEHSLQADLGLDYSGQYLSAQLSLFANRIGNYIFLGRMEGSEMFQYTQGDARLLGFEATLDLHPIHQLHFENSFSYVNARQLNQPEEQRWLPLTPAPRWTSELKYELTHHATRKENGRKSLQLCNTYVAVEMELNLAQDHFYRAHDTETRTPAYALWDLSAGTDLHWNGRHICTLNLTLQNVFNRTYQNHLSRLKYLEHEAANGRTGYANMGRNLAVRLTVPF